MSFALATTPVQFFDEAGNLIVNEAVTVTVVGSKVTTVLPPEQDGTYNVPVEFGQAVDFAIGPEQIGAKSVRAKLAANQGGPVPVVVPMGGPANDDCAAAQAIAVPSTTSGTTTGSSLDGVAACGGQSQTAGGVWYTLSGSGTTLQLTTCEGFGGSANYDTKISVFCQNCGALSCVAANDDGPSGSCPNFHSNLTFCGQSGGLYRVLVHGFGAGTGNFSLNAVNTGTSCTATVNCLPPVPEGSCCTVSDPPFSQGEVVVDCFVGTAAECAAAAGTYGGDDTECFTTVNEHDYVSNPNTPIPDNSVPTGVNTTINVPDAFTVADLNVDVRITHTWIGDLILTVTSPGGTSQIIWNSVCGATDNINATADDQGTETFCAPIAAGPVDSVFYPPAVAGEGPLSVFTGESATGTWTFNAQDDYPADVGTINQWSLHFSDLSGVCADFECADDPGGGGDDCLDCEAGPNGKVTICHFPPGNPSQRHTIEVGASALSAHCMNHGDTCGPCDEGDPGSYNDMTSSVGQTSSTFGQTNSTNNAGTSPTRTQVRR